jgi:NADPH:quinone reductase
MLSGEATTYSLTGFVNGVSLTGYMLTQFKVPGRFEAMKRYIFDHLADGTLKPKVDRTFPFEQAADAYRYLESNQQVGKIVITL